MTSAAHYKLATSRLQALPWHSIVASYVAAAVSLHTVDLDYVFGHSCFLAMLKALLAGFSEARVASHSFAALGHLVNGPCFLEVSGKVVLGRAASQAAGSSLPRCLKVLQLYSILEPPQLPAKGLASLWLSGTTGEAFSSCTASPGSCWRLGPPHFF